MTCAECSADTTACDCPRSIRPAPTVIDEAAQLVSNTRAAEHGDFERNATIASSLLADLGVDLDIADVPLALMALKLARHQSNPTNRDNIVDAIGYLALYARIIGMDA